ncbi:MAG: hypothetical protein P1V51_02675 [Deltaproteobacteria bacterium]|nr:hypothetical protein [Deltaproteobacteria bacterium]
MKLHLLFHDRCFDGLASAALFSVFHRARHGEESPITLVGLSHGPEGGLGEGRLGPEENAVVDFAYLASERLTWWFDHHRTAFERPGDEEHFRADRSGQKFFDPTAPSCTGFIARMLGEHFGFDTSGHSELIAAAERIDSASFSSPREAVELSSPACQLMLWIERSERFEDRVEVVRALGRGGVAEAVALPIVARHLGRYLEEHQQAAELIASHCQRGSDVVFCDLSGFDLDAINKFVPYHLHPEAGYAVILSRTGDTAKVSVGYNAWHAPEARRHDISAICRAEGGGGHPYVGAITRRLEAVEDLRAIAYRIVEHLEGDGS